MAYGPTWEVRSFPDSVHVLPIDDAREHALSATCACRPRVEQNERLLVVHDSWDGREYWETGHNPKPPDA